MNLQVFLLMLLINFCTVSLGAESACLHHFWRNFSTVSADPLLFLSLRLTIAEKISIGWSSGQFFGLRILGITSTLWASYQVRVDFQWWHEAKSVQNLTERWFWRIKERTLFCKHSLSYKSEFILADVTKAFPFCPQLQILCQMRNFLENLSTKIALNFFGTLPRIIE